ncbi:MAG: carboxypeptidase-like regulatory domain-containing protein [Sphingobacteriales bacterium]|nr:carboxypeptidase-like regulatory domain-containing protein [Sphingobacteriales bacterium]MBI3720356.1 carboxypeptidase-like regulatory domain-containing protein [Sphingobacteriales bacterium]
MNKLLLTICFGIIAQQLTAQNPSTKINAPQPGLAEKAQPGASVSIKGIVRTSDGKPAALVNVVLKETNNATITNELGEYFFYGLNEGKHTVIVSFVGLKTVQSEITVKKVKLLFLILH